MERIIQGNPVQIASLVETVFNYLCFAGNEEGLLTDENGAIVPAFEYEEMDDTTSYIKYDIAEVFPTYRVLLEAVLYHRFQDKALTSSVTAQPAVEKIEGVFRITTTPKNREQVLVDFFIDNGISEEEVVQLQYPVSLASNLYKVEMIVIGLSDDKMNKLNQQGKTQVTANKVHTKIEKVGSLMHTTTKIAMKDVVNPLAQAATKSGAVIASGVVQTAADCGRIVAAEALKGIAAFSIKDLKESDEWVSMKYSMRKIMNKGNKVENNKSQMNNYDL